MVTTEGADVQVSLAQVTLDSIMIATQKTRISPDQDQTNEQQIKNFDYDDLPPSVSKFLKGQVEKIRRSTSTCIINIGKDLIAAKHFLDHGTFLAWIEGAVGMPARTAQAYMKVAQWAAGKSRAVTSLPPTLLYLLSAPSTPPQFVADILQRVEAGEQIALQDARVEFQVLRGSRQEAPAIAEIAAASPKDLEAARERRDIEEEPAKFQSIAQVVSMLAELPAGPGEAEHDRLALTAKAASDTPGTMEDAPEQGAEMKIQRAVIEAVKIMSEGLSQQHFIKVREALTARLAVGDPALGRKILVAFSIVQQAIDKQES